MRFPTKQPLNSRETITVVSRLSGRCYGCVFKISESDPLVRHCACDSSSDHAPANQWKTVVRQIFNAGVSDCIGSGQAITLLTTLHPSAPFLPPTPAYESLLYQQELRYDAGQDIKVESLSGMIKQDIGVTSCREGREWMGSAQRVGDPSCRAEDGVRGTVIGGWWLIAWIPEPEASSAQA